METMISNVSTIWDDLWERRDKRMDDYPLMSNPLHTAAICCVYFYLIIFAGPRYMKDRKPMNIRGFMIVYNALMVILSSYIVIQALRGGWWNDYSFTCQPVDFSDSYKARLMMHVSYVFFISKFIEMTDSFCFVARKKFSHLSVLHVFHHGTVAMSTYPGVRWVPGGHSTFWGLLNSIVHVFMYSYYFTAALGPQYSKYVWWKQHITKIQMIQFIMIFIHEFQLFYKNECDYPMGISYFIACQAVVFFILFANFYIKSYLSKRSSTKGDDQKKSETNGVKNKAD